MYGVIYKLTNKLNGKPYIGQTKQKLIRRLNQHTFGQQYIDGVIQDVGWENFTVEVLEECETREQLNEREKFWIAHFNCKAPNGYNLTKGGAGSLEYICSDETREKKSVAVMGAKNPFWGRRHTTESKNLMSAAHMGNKSWLGRRHTAEENAKSSASHRGTTPYKNLLAEIDKHNFSYASLAKLLGISHQTVSDKMRGKIRFTERDKAKLVEIFGLPAEYLLERDANFVPVTSVQTGKHHTIEQCAKISITKRCESPYKNLLAEMDKRQISYRGLAELLSLSRPTISDKMRGKYNFTERDRAKLVEIFGLPIEYLLERDDGLPQNFQI